MNQHTEHNLQSPIPKQESFSIAFDARQYGFVKAQHALNEWPHAVFTSRKSIEVMSYAHVESTVSLLKRVGVRVLSYRAT